MVYVKAATRSSRKDMKLLKEETRIVEGKSDKVKERHKMVEGKSDKKVKEGHKMVEGKSDKKVKEGHKMVEGKSDKKVKARRKKKRIKLVPLRKFTHFHSTSLAHPSLHPWTKIEAVSQCRVNLLMSSPMLWSSVTSSLLRLFLERKTKNDRSDDVCPAIQHAK